MNFLNIRLSFKFGSIFRVWRTPETSKVRAALEQEIRFPETESGFGEEEKGHVTPGKEGITPTPHSYIHPLPFSTICLGYADL